MAETREPPQPIAEFRNVTKRFGAVVAARSLDLSIAPGEFLSFLGPSGCGKTTALRMLAGFEAPSEGEVRIDGAVVNDLPAHRRPVNMVFQHYALFPHLSVFDNIAYGLRQRRPQPPAAEVARAVGEALEMVRLAGYGPRRTWEMSGGQQQRVALARAIVNRPKLLLLDEPLAALDRKLRRDMQIELQTLQRHLGITFVLVTHDQEEALSMSDRIAILRDGRIVQVGAPQELYGAPVSRYVADFVGKSNFFAGRLDGGAGDLARVTVGAGPALAGRLAAPLPAGSAVQLSLRPEEIALIRTAPVAAEGQSAVPVTVANRIFLGEQTEYLVRNDVLGEFLVLVPRRAEADGGGFGPGDVATAVWDGRAALIFGND